MINLRFFPSRQLAWYMARLFLLRTLAVVGALVVILQTLDLLGETSKIFAHAGNTDAELWRYVSLRLPQLIAFVFPFGALLGTLITLATLNQNSEVVSMKAAGLSAHQILAPLVLASLVLAGVSYAFNERIVTRASETLADWQDADYGPVPRDTGMRPNVWVRYNEDLVLARQVYAAGEGTILSNVTIYDRTGETLQAIVSVKRAVRQGRGWLLRDVSRFDVSTGQTSRVGELHWGDGLEPLQFTLSKVKADQQTFPTLKHSISQLKASGRPTADLESGLWHKLSKPLSVVLMPLLGGIAAFGLARSGQLLVRAVIGMALGFAFFVADNFSLAMGNFGAYPPLVAAWAPFLLFLLIGETVLIRTEE
jgi:lipopolysaccharide export system permease protein